MDKNSQYIIESQEQDDSLFRKTMMGLLLGIAIGWVLLRYRRPTPIDKTNILRSAKEHEIEIPLSPVDEFANDKSTVIASSTSADQLEAIKGIGPVFAKRLYHAGIHTYRELADMSPEQLAEIVQAKPWQAIEIHTWITQAEQLSQKAN